MAVSQSTLENPDRVQSIDVLIRYDPSILYFSYIKNKLSDIEQSFIEDLELTGFLIEYVKTNENNLFYIVKSNLHLKDQDLSS